MSKLIKAAVAATAALAVVVPSVPVEAHSGYWHRAVNRAMAPAWDGFALYACRSTTQKAIQSYIASGHKITIINYCVDFRGAYWVSDFRYYH